MFLYGLGMTSYYNTDTYPEHFGLAIGQQLRDNSICANTFSNDHFKIPSDQRSSFHPKILESFILFIIDNRVFLSQNDFSLFPKTTM